MNFVYKIVKGNIYYCENNAIELSKDKIKRYSKRLNDMGVIHYIYDNNKIVLCD